MSKEEKEVESLVLPGINDGEPIPNKSLRLGTRVQIEKLESKKAGISPDVDAKIALLWLNDLLSDKYYTLDKLMKGEGPVSIDQIYELREEEMLSVVMRGTGLTEDDIKNLQKKQIKELRVKS